MINIREILTTLYADRSGEDIYIWLDDRQLLEPIKKVTTQLNEVLKDEQSLAANCRCLPVGHIACQLLWAVNTRIAREGNVDKAKEMENIVGEICSKILLSFLNLITSDKMAVWLQITFALKHACEFHNYDYTQLLRFLKIDSSISYLQTRRSADVVVSFRKVPSLAWQGQPISYNDFLHIFSEQKLIIARKGLAKLFENPNKPLQLLFDPLMADLTLQFFYTLKRRRLVTFSGCDGFYQVLEYHILDFKNFFPKNKSVGRRINALRQNKTKWDDNQRRINTWLRLFKLEKTGRPSVNPA